MLAGAALIATLLPLMTQELCSVSFYFLTYSIYTVSIVIIIQIKVEFLANVSDLRSTVLKKMVLKKSICMYEYAFVFLEPKPSKKLLGQFGSNWH